MVLPPSWRALGVLGISSAVVFAVANEEETCSSDGNDNCGATGDALLQSKRLLNREDMAALSEVDAETGITGMTSSWLSSFFKGEAHTSTVQSKVSDDGKTAAVNFRHEGKDVSYLLRSFSVWSEDARMFAHTEQGEVERPIPSRRSFQARDNDNNHGLWASAVVHENMVTGLFQLEGGRVLRIEHVNTSQSGKPSMMEVENSHTMQLVDLSRIFSGKKCVMVDGECVHDGGDDGKDGINHVPTMSSDADEEGLLTGTATWNGVKWYPGCYSGDNVLNEFKMGAVMDVDGFQEHGANAAPLLEKAFAESSFVYEQQLNVKLSIGYMKIWESETGAPNYAVGCSPVLKLSEFKARAAQDMPAGLGASHIFTGCGTGYGTVGRAWVGTICRTDGYNTGTNQFHKSKDWLTFAHELGHNFAGKHSFEEGQGKTGGIMDYGDGLLDGTYQFNTKYRKQEMCNKMNQAINKCGGGFKEAPPQGTWRVTSGKCTTDSAGCLRSPNYKDSSESLTQEYGWGSRTENRRAGTSGGSGGGNDWWTRRRTAAPTTTTTTSTKWTDQYPNDAECTVTVVEESKPIKVVHFSTEEGDELSVNGVAYSGTGEGLAGIVPRGTMTWKSNAAGTSTGFKICPSGEETGATPTPKPPGGTPSPGPPAPGPPLVGELGKLKEQWSKTEKAIEKLEAELED